MWTALFHFPQVFQLFNTIISQIFQHQKLFNISQQTLNTVFNSVDNVTIGLGVQLNTFNTTTATTVYLLLFFILMSAESDFPQHFQLFNMHKT